MKAIFCLLASVCLTSAQTNTNSAPIIVSFTNSVGFYVTNAEVVSVAPNKLIYRANGGLVAGTIRLEKLPPDLQAKFNYDPDEANKADQMENDKKIAEREKQMAIARDVAEAAQEILAHQTAAKHEVDNVAETIRAKAQKEWPGDYDMQVYEINKQTEAYNWLIKAVGAEGVPTETFYQIKAKAASEWPNDYDMQKYEIEKQVNAYIRLHP